MRILVAVEPVDFRRGIDGLAQVCREVLAADPFSGTVFVFRGRLGKAKLLSRSHQMAATVQEVTQAASDLARNSDSLAQSIPIFRVG
jgi:transposase